MDLAAVCISGPETPSQVLHYYEQLDLPHIPAPPTNHDLDLQCYEQIDSDHEFGPSAECSIRGKPSSSPPAAHIGVAKGGCRRSSRPKRRPKKLERDCAVPRHLRSLSNAQLIAMLVRYEELLGGNC